MKDTQILFAKQQSKQLRERSKKTKKSIASIVRKAVDNYFEEGEK